MFMVSTVYGVYGVGVNRHTHTCIPEADNKHIIAMLMLSSLSSNLIIQSEISGLALSFLFIS